jgi:CheY-like chemotaxis protein
VLAGRSILIVEDEPLLALNVDEAFKAGASIMSASNSREAAQLIGLPHLSAAVVDINLGEEDCSAVCELLSDKGVPFVFYIGNMRADILQKWPKAPVLTKLAKKDRIIEAVVDLLRWSHSAICRPRCAGRRALASKARSASLRSLRTTSGERARRASRESAGGTSRLTANGSFQITPAVDQSLELTLQGGLLPIDPAIQSRPRPIVDRRRGARRRPRNWSRT